jgi:hypothetical protein
MGKNSGNGKNSFGEEEDFITFPERDSTAEYF